MSSLPIASSAPMARPRLVESALFQRRATAIYRQAHRRVPGDTEPSRLLALHANRIGRLAVNGVVSYLQGCLIHTEWHKDRDDLKDDEGGDHIVHDDERRPFGLKQELVGVAVEQACHVDARSL